MFKPNATTKHWKLICGGTLIREVPKTEKSFITLPKSLSPPPKKNIPLYFETSHSSETVLSAAHCFHDSGTGDRIPESEFKVELGKEEIKKDGLKIGVRKIIIHPENVGHLKADYAIVRLEKSISFSKKMNPACLPDPSKTYERVEALASGWGDKEHDEDKPEKFPNKLQLVRSVFFGHLVYGSLERFHTNLNSDL